MRASTEIRRIGLAFLLSALAHAAILFSTAPKVVNSNGARAILDQGQGMSDSAQMTSRIIHARVHIDHPLTTPTRADSASMVSTPATSPAPVIESSRFYEAAQLSRLAAPQNQVDLNVSEALLITNPGKMTLTLFVNARGEVVAYEIYAPELPEEFSRAIAEAFKATPFNPAEIAGVRVSSRVQMEISVDSTDSFDSSPTP